METVESEKSRSKTKTVRKRFLSYNTITRTLSLCAEAIRTTDHNRSLKRYLEHSSLERSIERLMLRFQLISASVAFCTSVIGQYFRNLSIYAEHVNHSRNVLPLLQEAENFLKLSLRNLFTRVMNALEIASPTMDAFKELAAPRIYIDFKSSFGICDFLIWL